MSKLRDAMPLLVAVGLIAPVSIGCGSAAPPEQEAAPVPGAAPAPTAPASSGILQPELAPIGTYASPMGSLGTADTAESWTMTTYGAAVNGRPLDGSVQTVTGEIIDVSCYLQLGKHGDAHRSCSQNCFSHGEPIGLLAEDGTVYLLMAEEHDPRRDGQTTFREAATEHAAHVMQVTGTVTQHDGYKAMFVHGYLAE